MHPLNELLWWERFAFVFFESAKRLQIVTKTERQRHFESLFAIANSGVSELEYSKADFVEKKRLEAIIDLFNECEIEYQSPEL